MKSRVFFTAVLQEQVSESFIQHRRCLTRCFEQQTATIQPLKTCRREKTRTVELIIFVCCSFFVQTRLYKCSSLNIAKCMFMGVRRYFLGGPKSTFCLSFSVCWRCNANGRTQKMCNVTATITTTVFPIRNFYTEKMFVLVRMDI